MASLTDRILVTIDAASQGAVKELNRLQSETKKTSDALDNMGKKIGITGSTLKVGLATAAAALGGGFLLAVKNSVDAFGDAAKSAGEMATAMGSTPETISRMTAALEDSGIAADKSAAMLTKFTVNFSKNVNTLKALNVDIAKGPQGQTDYATTMVRVIDAIDALGDATERNRLSVQLFGKQGAAAFNELRASGISLADAMAAIDKHRVFTADDVKRAVQFDDAMDSMAASLQGLEFSLGRALIPLVSTFGDVISTAFDAVNPLLDMLAEIPPDVYLVAGAFMVLNKALAITVGLNVGASLGKALASLQFMAVTGTLAATAVESLRAAFARLASVGGVLTILAAAYAALSFGQQKLKADAEEAAVSMAKLQQEGKSASEALKITAAEMDKSAGTLERWAATIDGLSWGNFWDDLINGKAILDDTEARTRGFNEALTEAEKKMGALGVASAGAAKGIKSAKDAATDLTTGTGYAQIAFSNLVASAKDANQAAYDTQRATNLAEQAMGRYAVSIQQVVAWQSKLAGQTSTVEEALNNIQTSYETLVTDSKGKQFWKRITDDTKTFGNESTKATADATQAIYDYIDALAAVPGTTSTEIIANLKKLKDNLPADLDKVVDQAITRVEGKQSEVGVNLDLKPVLSYQGKTYPKGFIGPIPLEAEMTIGGVPVTQAVNVKPAVDPKSLATSKNKLDTLAADRHTTVYVKIKPQGQSVADIIGQPGGNMAAAPASYSQAYSTRFDLRGSTFVTPDPAAMYDQLNRMAARRKMAGRR